ncbi:MAG TPA: 7,8-didemethyl-8-hydroxy-5-deazariboflavin synthase subunit CofG [Methanothrix sp.]|nr:7,8-didemethyl-8-hydroxy-5-deazariboflavin synthase subunit CofG [Methanothrix sp.]HPT19232.1 7,8-didemethyl-8-hydroxy-5-deazariboflavin synthase subunit CofG [Methanothrix sp.]
MKTITYSKNIFIAVTNLCRNRCSYCSFRKDLKDARVIGRSQARRLMEAGADAGCSEALFTMGESPWEQAGFFRLLEQAGASDIIDYLVELAEMALESGLLPHTNAGILSMENLRRLQPYNASMGLMLESTARLPAHEGSPGKNPDSRLQFMAAAGRMRIPFTTGILIGIGESDQDRRDALLRIAQLHSSYGHIQEVIIQPLDPKPGTALASADRPRLSDICRTVQEAKSILPADVAIQIPPNLADPLPAVAAGATDLGGISPLTEDGINPGRPWPREEELKTLLPGYCIRERLPIYPRFIDLGWQGSRTGPLLRRLAGQDGLAGEKVYLLR